MITRKELEAIAEKLAAEVNYKWRAPRSNYRDAVIAGFLAAVPIIFEATHERMPKGQISFNGHRGWRLKYTTAADILKQLTEDKS